MNWANEAKPTKSPARLVKSTWRWTNIRMSTSGSRTRRSISTQSAATTTEPASEPSVRAEDQPHSWPCEMPSSSRTRKTARLSAPSTSIRPPVGEPPCGTTAATAASASTVSAVENQKTRW